MIDKCARIRVAVLLLAAMVAPRGQGQESAQGDKEEMRLYVRDRCILSGSGKEDRLVATLLGMIVSFAVSKGLGWVDKTIEKSALPEETTKAAERGMYLYRRMPTGLARNPNFGCLILLQGTFEAEENSADSYERFDRLQDTFHPAVRSANYAPEERGTIENKMEKELKLLVQNGIAAKKLSMAYEVEVVQDEDPRYFQLENAHFWLAPKHSFGKQNADKSKTVAYVGKVSLWRGPDELASFGSSLFEGAYDDDGIDQTWPKSNCGKDKVPIGRRGRKDSCVDLSKSQHRSQLIVFGSDAGEVKLMQDTEAERARRRLQAEIWWQGLTVPSASALDQTNTTSEANPRNASTGDVDAQRAATAKEAEAKAAEARITNLALQDLAQPLPTVFVPITIKMEVVETISKRAAELKKAVSKFIKDNQSNLTTAIVESLPLPQTAKQKKEAAEGAEKAMVAAIATYRSACVAFLSPRPGSDTNLANILRLNVENAHNAAAKLGIDRSTLGGGPQCN
jgi:hypothetical protein